MKKLIILEINEVPFKIFDFYLKQNPETQLAKVISNSKQYVTVSSDTGELHPWSTWPTFYRGVDNTKHLIKDIGEDLNERNKEYPPVWDFLNDNKVTAGVFSSLHTYPLPENFADFKFLVPDPFANGSETHPKVLEPFQAFNLAMTKKSGRSVDKGIDKKSAIKLVAVMPKIGIRVRTLLSTAKQLVHEKISPWKTSRRRTYQSILAFDLFLKQLKKKKPEFVTFFSNHVASAMHRYWAATFPEDYENNKLPTDWINRYKNEIPFCMNQLNDMVSDVCRFIKKNPEYKLIIASSMGQSATTAELVEHELFLVNYTQLSSALEIESLKPLAAMHPQYNFSVAAEEADETEKKLERLTINEVPIRFRRKDGTFFSIDLGFPNVSHFDIKNHKNEKLTLDELGFELKKIDDQSAGTAYHIPQGSFFVYDIKNPIDNPQRKEVDLREVAPSILNYFDVKKPDYMKKGEIAI